MNITWISLHFRCLRRFIISLFLLFLCPLQTVCIVYWDNQKSPNGPLLLNNKSKVQFVTSSSIIRYLCRWIHCRCNQVHKCTDNYPPRCDMLPVNCIHRFVSHIRQRLQITATSHELEALAQCIPPPRHVLPVSRYQSHCLSSAGDVFMSQLLWRCLLVHVLHCSVAHRSRLTPLSVSPNGAWLIRKQSPYPDGDRDCHQNLVIYSMAHCQPSLKISCKSQQKFLRKVAKSQTNKQCNYTSSLAEVIVFG